MGGGEQDRRLWPAANTLSHTFGSDISTGGDSIDHRCACLGNNWAYCTGVCVGKVHAIEGVNTIWGAASLDQDQSSPPTAEEKLGPSGHNTVTQIHHSVLYNPSSHLRLASTCCPAAFRVSEYEDRGQQGREDAQPPLLLLSWSGEGLEAFLGFN